MKKIIKKIVVILSLICIGLLFIGETAVKADDVDNYNINSKALYDETNTYNYLYDTTIPNGTEVKNGIDRSFNNDARYDMKSQNGNKVMSNKTQITVFTHGWNGHADSWGSGEDSLVTKLGKLINANIYTLDLNDIYIMKRIILRCMILMTNIIKMEMTKDPVVLMPQNQLY